MRSRLLGIILFLVAGVSSVAAQELPERIISLSPNLTEMIWGVGAFDRVVAVSEFCDFPPEVENLPRVGGWQNTNLEKVAALRPDLVILTEAQAPFVKDHLDGLGIPALVVRAQSIADIKSAILQIGRAVGRSEEASRLVAELEAELEAVRRLTEGLSRPRVLYVVDRLPGTLRDLYVATSGSFFSELVEIAGGEPLTPPANHQYTKISMEAMVSMDPEIILDIAQSFSGPTTVVGTGADLAEDPGDVWNELGEVKAVRDGRVYPLHDLSLVHPSQFVGRAARRIAEIIHPEAFAEGEK
jgi:iron complex transport system substrate-binding protein